jgi:hypothetical protein
MMEYKNSWTRNKFLFYCVLYFTVVEFVKEPTYTFQLLVRLGSKAADEKQFSDSHLVPFLHCLISCVPFSVNKHIISYTCISGFQQYITKNCVRG